MKKITSTEKGIISALPLFFLGFFAGGINGLLGAGGGALLVFGLSKLEKDTKKVFAETVAAVGIMSIVSAAVYGIRYGISLGDAAKYALPAAAGGIFGGWMGGKIKTVWLNRLFAILVIYAGIRMIV